MSAKLHSTAGKKRRQIYSWTAGCLLSIAAIAAVLITPKQAEALQMGDSGAEVTALQQRLQQMGYYGGRITGYFGEATAEAVRRFQAAKGLPTNGVVGPRTEAALRPARRQQAAANATRQPKEIVNLQAGETSTRVRSLQRRLKRLGYYSGRITGNFDSQTQAALIKFQQAQGLPADGIAGPQTLAALGNSRPAAAPSNTRTAPNNTAPRTAPSNTVSTSNLSREDVIALQQRLQEKGFYQGPIDGLLGPQTLEAIAAAQKAYGISTDDLLDEGF